MEWWHILLAVYLHFLFLVIMFEVWVHRGTQHSLLEFSPKFTHFCRFLLWSMGWGTTPDWLRFASGTHRSHHQYSDTPEDPHSPFIESFAGLYIDNKYSKYFATHTEEDILKVAPDVPLFEDWVQKKIYNDRGHLGLLVPITIYTLLFGWVGLLVGICWTLFLKYFFFGFCATWPVHKLVLYRHRDHQFPDRSGNMLPFGLLLGGIELHSNHHVNQKAINQRCRWFEFDIVYWVIKLFELCGWVKIKYHIVEPNKF